MEAFGFLDESISVRELPDPEQENLEYANLEPEWMDVPGVGEVLVSGDPFEIAPQLNDCQGNNIYNCQGDCGLVSVCNILTMADIPATENEVLFAALRLNLCTYSEFNDPLNNGATNVFQRKALLEVFGIPSHIIASSSEAGSLEALAQYVEAGHGVSISVNSGYAWDNANFIDDGGSNHCIIVTGTARDPDTGKLKGLFVCDSGLVQEPSAAKFLSVDVLQDAYLDVPGTHALVTSEAIR